MAMFSLAGRFAGDEGAAQRYAVGMVAFSEMQIVQGGITQTFHYERQFGTLWVLFSSAGSRIVAYLSRGRAALRKRAAQRGDDAGLRLAALRGSRSPRRTGPS